MGRTAQCARLGHLSCAKCRAMEQTLRPGTRPGPSEVQRVSVYKVIELIGTSEQSWEDAAASAVKKARESLRGLRVAEVIEQDLDLGEGDVITYRTKLRVSFKYEGGS